MNTDQARAPRLAEAAEDLRAMVDSVRDASPLQFLKAAAILCPARVAEWLVAHASWTRDHIDSSELESLLTQLLATPQVETSEDALPPVAETFADLLTLDTAADLLGRYVTKSGAPGARVLETALQRSPTSPRLLRIAARRSADEGSIPDAHALLSRLARAEPTLATVQAVYRERSRLPPPPGAAVVRIALASSFTIEPLVPFLDLECRDAGLQPAFYVGPFNQWYQELVSSASGLHAFQPDVAILAVSLDDLVPELASHVAAPDLERLGTEAVDRVAEAAQGYAAGGRGALVVHSMFSTYLDPGPVGRSPRGSWIADLNRRLRERLEALPHTYLLDVADAAAHRTGGTVEDPKLRHLAGMRYGEALVRELAAAHMCRIAPLKGLTRKCVVVDLDNTLWGGVVGEDGLDGIKLGNTAPGAEYRDFQAYLKALPARGILLAVNSKNNPDDALDAIRNHDGMLLREHDFSAIRVNWLPKPENMRSIAEELNIGLDSLVFLDDKPEERALMRHALPEVLTPELPHDPALFRHVVERLPQLQSVDVTEEDRGRAAQYRAARQREAARTSTRSLDSFLQDLRLTVRIADADAGTLGRVHQLFQRTNQFNLTTHRYDATELARMAEQPDVGLYVLWAADRFGDHGLVGTALVRMQQDAWTIDSFLLSCRALGCGVESALLARIAAAARERGAHTLLGAYRETKKNLPARDFYRRHGFTHDQTSDATETWRLDLTIEDIPMPGWISVAAK